MGQDVLKSTGRVDWRATLTTRSHSRSSKKTRYVVFVEDAATPHLKEIHASPQCAFSRSWKEFNLQTQGHSHKVLSWCSFLLGIFLFIGGAAVYIVNYQVNHGAHKRASKYKFHIIIMVKFLLQDVPQQLCIVLYLAGWFEASGLRCQLCLFNPAHCGDQQAFHLANLAALTCCLLSSVSNQLLVRPVFMKVYTEDDICVQYTLRIAGLCVAVLPFTTGMCCMSKSVLSMPTLVHVLFVVPCGIGWFSLAAFIWLPLIM